MTKRADTDLSFALISGLLQSPLYPINYVKVLIQMGHEPLPPFSGRTFFGNDKFYYPNALSYMRYIYSVEGVTGLYRGLGMKIISQSVGTIFYNHAVKMLHCEEEEKAKLLTEESDMEIFMKTTSKEIAARCWGVIFSHPFHVMAIRCMAQFVGGETSYSSWNVFQNVGEIYRSEGIFGFFSGVVPRLLFEASTIALTNGFVYIIKTYILNDDSIAAITDLFGSILASSITYPLSLVSTVSSISGSGLLAGKPPRMAIYTSWIETFKHLYEINEMKRGSSSFFRIYNPHSISKRGFVLAKNAA